MNRAIAPFAIALAISGLALPQAPPTTQQIVSSTLADMRGVREVVENPTPDTWMDRKALWFSIVDSGEPATGRVYRVPSPAGTISAKLLRHPIPKAARKAYEQGVRTKDPQKAAREFERALALDPDFVQAHSDLGVVYARAGLFSQAAAEFRRAIELAPEESIPYSNLAWLYFATGQRAEALENVQRALKLSPNNAAARILLARMDPEAPR